MLGRKVCMYRHLNVYLALFGTIAILSLLVSFNGSFLKALKLNDELTQQTSVRLPEYHFVLIGEEVDNAYWRLVERGARAGAQHFDVFVEYKGPQRSNLEEHVKLIDMAVASKVDGIITQALNEVDFAPIINDAMEKGIPVITIDTDAPRSDRVAYVGTDNFYSGMLAGKAVIEDTRGEIKIGIITGNVESEHQKLRVKGFMEAIKDVKRIEVVAIEESNISRLEAEQKAYKLLENFEDLNAFYGTSALDGIGIVAAMNKTGKNDLYVIAFDALAETVELLKQDRIQAIVAQEPFEMGFRSVEVLMEALHSAPVETITHTETTIIRKKDLNDGEQEIQVIGDANDEN